LKAIRKEKYMGKEARKENHRKDPRKVMLSHARSRAKRYGVPFSITKDDLLVPDLCPLLAIPLQVSNKHLSPNSPTIDRLITDKGYVKGNVMIISAKANTAKSNLSLQELELLVNNLKRVLHKEEELLEC